MRGITFEGRLCAPTGSPLNVYSEKKEIIGSDVSVILDQKNFGVSQKSDPRFVANDIFLSENTHSVNLTFFVKHCLCIRIHVSVI